MILNIECIREILLFLEKNLTYVGDSMEHSMFTMYQVTEAISKEKKLDEKQLMYAIEKMYEARIIEADIHYGAQHSILYCNIYDISFYGHQFLESIRPETIWKKTKSIVGKVGNHSIKFVEDTAQKCAVTATAALINKV